ncbi:mastin-like [Tupaia chinensis]|uniref:mastin-like n=1 Tax=Tupaia chinensis TaxID=246437 RepID=UPI0003C900B4|nr:mastin-like [Tupaia chinensis]
MPPSGLEAGGLTRDQSGQASVIDTTRPASSWLSLCVAGLQRHAPHGMLLPDTRGARWCPCSAYTPALPGHGREDLEACSFRVQAGQLRLYDHDQLTRVAGIIRHPKYNESLSAEGGADVALLRLEAPLELSEHVHPVSLPPASLTVPPGKTCWVTGWGDVADDTPLPPPYQLQEVNVPIVGWEDCDQRYQNLSSPEDPSGIGEDMLCAGSKGRDSCQLDSGGPLVCRWNCTWVQVGVVSWGHLCGHRDFPGVYTSVMSYVPWILQYVPLFPGP